jgi:hypothetical protein
MAVSSAEAADDAAGGRPPIRIVIEGPGHDWADRNPGRLPPLTVWVHNHSDRPAVVVRPFMDWHEDRWHYEVRGNDMRRVGPAFRPYSSNPAPVHAEDLVLLGPDRWAAIFAPIHSKTAYASDGRPTVMGPVDLPPLPAGDYALRISYRVLSLPDYRSDQESDDEAARTLNPLIRPVFVSSEPYRFRVAPVPGRRDATPSDRIACPDGDDLWAAAWELRQGGEVGDATAAELLFLLADGSALPDVRTAAAIALSGRRPIPPEAFSALIRTVGDSRSSPEAREYAAQVFRDITPPPPWGPEVRHFTSPAAPAVPALTAMLRMKDDLYQHETPLQALAAIGPAARSAVPELLAMLERPDAPDWQIVGALSAVGADPPDIPAVSRALWQWYRRDPTVRHVALVALARLERPLGAAESDEIAERLVRCVADPWQGRRCPCICGCGRALAAMGAAGHAAAPRLRELCGRAFEPDVRVNAAFALMGVDPSSELPAKTLAAMLLQPPDDRPDDDDPRLTAIGEVRLPPARAALLALAGSEGRPGADGLLRSVTPALLESLRHGPLCGPPGRRRDDESLLHTMAEVLARVGPPARRWLPELRAVSRRYSPVPETGQVALAVWKVGGDPEPAVRKLIEAAAFDRYEYRNCLPTVLRIMEEAEPTVLPAVRPALQSLDWELPAADPNRPAIRRLLAADARR